MGLRLKFLSLLIIVPSICLGSFLYFALTTFIGDKTANLYESQLELLTLGAHALSQAAGANARPSTPADLNMVFGDLFKQESFTQLLVADSTGVVRFAKDAVKVGKNVADVLGKNAYEKLVSQKSQEGSFETSDANSLLVSFLGTQAGGNNFLLLLSKSKSTATRASLLFFYKALATFVALISFATLASLLFSNQLTSGIVRLSNAMVEFGGGRFDSELPKARNDEVGRMTAQFRRMRTQIKELILDQQKKTEIETEMKLAGDLQKRFFPDQNFISPTIDFAAYFEPASNAGGDWWFHFQSGPHFVFLIGDVTGHGLNAAMLTGVCRSAFSLIESSYEDPARSMALLNRAFYDSSRQELNMTCCVCELNTLTGQLRWANASHEAPLILPANTENLRMKDLTEVVGVNGYRLGERRDSLYENGEASLKPGDALFLYTDGLPDLIGPEEKKFGERGMIRAFSAGFTPQISSRELISRIELSAAEHRQKMELVDDVSYLIVKWKPLA